MGACGSTARRAPHRIQYERRAATIDQAQLAADLATQNAKLAQALKIAA
ncbi:hypothetical protein MAXJ12_28038 [Mesorhizobium alhagi CCNWXJ12-2]|jgi:hypothetical protein|uniref:Uncharacterized protein n=1 Tax=Mesorhizobium alhagi CCNWXJ12-2 TaxID=1107882 RepID=H0HZH4_9HYPH|nr:hypothetical protein MAXJ12_28038 [Mesorhizobium alhagi CCNWXJ12-2]